MMIGEFARKTGLPAATIRFYMRKRLLAPGVSLLGGGNPYASFSERDVQTARMIRFGQSLGMSLKDIAAVNDEMQTNDLSRERAVAIMDEQLATLERKAQELTLMASYLRAKRNWIAEGQRGDEPVLATSLPCSL